MAEPTAIYRNISALNADKHRDLSVKTDGKYGFARALPSVPLALSEFADVAPEMPIVFARDGDALAAVAVMGLSAGENLMVAGDGSWGGGYVPAFLRRYPFILTEPNENNRQALCLDDDFAGLNRDGIGERLFDAEGAQTAYTRGVLEFAQRLHNEYRRTRTFAEKLADRGLLEDVEATIRSGERQPRRLRGFQAVSREKLAALPDDAMLAMARSGELELIHLHLVSLKTFTALDRRSSASVSGEAA